MNAPITYIEKFVSSPNEMFIQLWTELAWVRRGNTPRREYYYNDFPVPYTYGSGQGVRTYMPQPIHSGISVLKTLLYDTFGVTFEVCFLNGYEDGSDHLGWHADDSPEMDDARPIAIISLGAERDIMFMKRDDKASVERLKLHHGSLCLMKPGMQDTHLHRIPKAGFICGPRLSLTFRGYVR